MNTAGLALVPTHLQPGAHLEIIWIGAKNGGVGCSEPAQWCHSWQL